MIEKPNDVFAASIQPEKNAKRILILTANDAQDLEFFYPYYRFIEAGYHVDVATPKGGEFKGKQGMGLKYTIALSDADASQYALLYIPGGNAPEELKRNEDALSITKHFADSKKPIAAICHGAQLLAAAKVIKGYNIAAWPAVEGEIKEAGGKYVNEATVIDGQFITARWPGDLPSHLAHTLEALEEQQLQQTKLPRLTANA